MNVRRMKDKCVYILLQNSVRLEQDANLILQKKMKSKKNKGIIKAICV